MKKITKILTAVAALSATTIPLTTLVACGSKEEPQPEPTPPVDPRISRDDLNIENGVLYGLKEDADISECTTLEIPSDVTAINEDAFKGVFTKAGANKNITSLTFCKDANSALVSIGDGAFNGCDSLNNELILPSSLRTIGNRSFGNTSFKLLRLNDGLQEIGMNGFRESTIANERLTIPASVTTIGNNAFADCKKLSGVLEILSCKTVIWSGAFANCGFVLIDLLNFDATTCAEIRDNWQGSCFSGFAETIYIVTNFVYPHLEELTKLIVDKNSTWIEEVIPSTLTTTGDFEFELDSSRTFALIKCLKEPEVKRPINTLYIPKTCEINGKRYPILSIADSAFTNIPTDYYDQVKTIYFNRQSNIKIIGDNAFANSRFTNSYGETSIPLIIPDSVKNIGKNAFAETKLNCTLSFDGDINMVGEGAFAVHNEANLIVRPEAPSKIKNVLSGTFDKCSLKLGDTNHIVISNQTLHANSLKFKNIDSVENIVLFGWTEIEQAKFDGNPFGVDFTKKQGKVYYPQTFDEQEEYDVSNYVLLSNNIVSSSWLSHYNEEVGFIKNSGPTNIATNNDQPVSGDFKFTLGNEINYSRGLKCIITGQQGFPEVEGKQAYEVEIDQTKIIVDKTNVTVPVSFVEGLIGKGVRVEFTIKFVYNYYNLPIWEQEVNEKFTLSCGASFISFSDQSQKTVDMTAAHASTTISFNLATQLSAPDLEAGIYYINKQDAWEYLEIECLITNMDIHDGEITLSLEFIACHGDVAEYEKKKSVYPAALGMLAFIFSYHGTGWKEVVDGPGGAFRINPR